MTLSVMYIGAHPDDEGSAGGTLARYAAQGLRVYVACATRGDGVDAKIKNDAATPETLGQVRSQELTAACAALGVQPPLFLGHQDGEVDQVDRETAAQALAQLFQRYAIQIVMTHGPEGGYGHPDHIAVSALVTRAVDMLGPVGPVRKLYYTATPRSYLERVPAFKNRRADIRGGQLGFVGVPDELITTRIDIRPWLPAKLAALACHRSQFEFDANGQPRTFAASVPEAEREEFFGYERFVLARPAGALPREPQAEQDLLSGLPSL